jgi:hypothetical protein
VDINEAIAAHVNWKVQLLMYVEKVGHPTLGEVSHDDSCALGRWLKAEAPLRAGQPAFEKARSTHARFHQLAWEIVRKADAGDKEGALRDINGAFSELSFELVAQLQLFLRKA